MIQDDLAALRQWSVSQPAVRLVEGPPLVDEEIDRLPELIDEAHSSGLPVPFRPGDFAVPRSYRAFLRICSFLRIEYRNGGSWATYDPLNIFSPQEVAKGHSFIDGATLDDEEIYTSFLVAFATAGYATEASRWCFYTDADVERQDGELAILCESNDFECDLAKYVETGLWVPDPFNHPASLSFADWFHRLVRVVIQHPFDAEHSSATGVRRARRGRSTDGNADRHHSEYRNIRDLAPSPATAPLSDQVGGQPTPTFR